MAPRPALRLRIERFVTANLLAFIVAALLEIVGCFTFWMCLRRARSPAIALLGILSLVAFAVVMLTRVDAAFAGRAYAAYGGMYIAASPGGYGTVEGQRPTAPDSLGALLTIAGAVVIVGAAAKRRSELILTHRSTDELRVDCTHDCP